LSKYSLPKYIFLAVCRQKEALLALPMHPSQWFVFVECLNFRSVVFGTVILPLAIAFLLVPLQGLEQKANDRREWLLLPAAQPYAVSYEIKKRNLIFTTNPAIT
jgi:hypothetical protein